MARQGLKEEVVARLNEATTIDLFQRLGLQLRRSGSEFKALCCFHEDHNPSLCINPAKGQGVWKCFVCGAGGPDVIAFVQQLHRLTFPQALEHVAAMLGIDGAAEKDLGKAAPEQRPVVPSIATEYMTEAEVAREYKRLRDEAIDLDGPMRSLGVDPRAAALIGAIVVEQIGKRVLVVPMRDATGDMCSLRFRCFVTRKRWSLDQKKRVDGELVKVKSTRAGLMAPLDYWDDSNRAPGSRTIVIEGETDLLAAVTMMIRETGSVDPTTWPANWVAVPGCGSCHDMLCESPLSPTVQTFLDNDEAGLNAVFSRRRRRRDGTLGDRHPGLLEKIRANGRTCWASCPPRRDGGKVDLRDMVREGWTWRQFDDWSRQHGTFDIHGRKLIHGR